MRIPERPGAFQQFCQVLGKLPVTEFNYRYGRAEEAQIFVGVGTSQGNKQRTEILERLQRAALPVIDLTHDEMAKLHIRFMVGGRSLVEHERLFRFEFPERPGALLQFLTAIGGRWNISLFHYRNHGADFGRVLAGFEVPASDSTEFETFLNQLGYPYQRERTNAAYDLFLK